MRAAVLTAPRKMEIQEREKPVSKNGSVIVKVLATAICGADNHYYESGDQVDMIRATQRVSMRYLDLAALTAGLDELTAKELKVLVQTREHDQVYDAQENYLPEITQEAYMLALERTLKDAPSCYTTIEFDISLKYVGGEWHVLTAPELLTALSGGTGV